MLAARDWGERPADGKKPEGLRVLVVDEDMRKLIRAKLRRMNIDLIVEAQSRTMRRGQPR